MRRGLLLYPALFLFLAGMPALAQECAPVDLRQGPRGHLLREPRDQDSFGLCYAFVAADLVSFHLGRQVSAMHLSYAYNKEIAQSFLSRVARLFDDNTPLYDNGFVDHAVTRFNRYGGCLESEMPSDTSRLNAYSVLSDFGKWSAAHREVRDGVDQERCRDVSAYWEENTGLRALFPALDVKAFTLLMLRNKGRHLADQLHALAEAGCRNPAKIRPEKPYPVETEHFSLRQLNRQLTGGHLVAVSYRTDRFYAGSGGLHVSSVIARRWKNGVCQYLIRNSLGKGCSIYADGIECDGEAGAFWADEADLKAALIQAAWIPSGE